MNLNLNQSGESHLISSVSRANIVINDQMVVLDCKGDLEPFVKDIQRFEKGLLSDLLSPIFYEKLHHYILQSFLVRRRIISDYYYIKTPSEKLAVRFLISPLEGPSPATAIELEAMAVNDNTLIQGKPVDQALITEESKEISDARRPIDDIIFDKSPFGIVLADRAGNLLKGNLAFSEQFGYLLEEINQLKLSCLSPSLEFIHNTFTSGELMQAEAPLFDGEKEFRNKWGESFTSRIKIFALKTHDGKAANFIVYFDDTSTENALKAVEAKYDLLFSASNDAIFLMENEQFIDCNERALHMFSCGKADIINKTPSWFSPEFQIDGQSSTFKFKEKIERTLSGKAQFFYWKFRKMDGSDFEAEVSLKSLTIQKEPLVQLIVKDITQRKEGEKAIRESESRFKAIFEGAGIGIAMIDPYGNLIESNQALEDFLGYSKEELLGKAIIELVHPEDRDFENRYLIFHQGAYRKPGFFEKRYIRKDGQVIWGKLTTTVIQDDRGIPEYGIGMLEDITQRKLAEKKAMENQDLLNRINENLSEGIYRSIPGKGLVYANKAFAKMFGYESVAEALRLSSDSLNDFYDEKDKRKRLLKEIKRKGYLRNKEALFRKKDGSTFWGLENSTFSTTPEGRMIIDGVVVDITERRNSEELLKNKNEELKKINEELDRFVYSASHDLRAPLTSLLGLINIAQTDRYINGISEHLELMRKSVLKLDTFIIDIINYSRNARLDLEVDEINLAALVNETLDNLRYISAADKIDKKVKILQNVPLYTDGKRLSILLSNLISNAIRYHNLIKDKPFIEIKGKVTKKEVRLAIVDNGKGIGKQYLDNIFEMFFRASDDSKGSGLGLYIVKETVNKLNGTIAVSSEVGKGSTFTIVIPNLPPSRKKTEEIQDDL